MFLERVETSDVRSSRQEISCGGYYNDIAVVVVVVVVVAFVGCPRARRFTRERLSRAMDSRVGSAELARASFQARARIKRRSFSLLAKFRVSFLARGSSSCTDRCYFPCAIFTAGLSSRSQHAIRATTISVAAITSAYYISRYNGTFGARYRADRV